MSRSAEASSPSLTSLFLGKVAAADRSASRLLESRLAEHDLSLAEFRLTGLLLGEGEGRSQKDLAQLLGVTPASLSGAVDRLAKKGVVERVADLDDARVRRVRLVPRVPRLGKVAGILHELEGIALAGLSEADLAAAHRVVEQIQSNLQAVDHEPEPAKE